MKTSWNKTKSVGESVAGQPQTRRISRRTKNVSFKVGHKVAHLSWCSLVVARWGSPGQNQREIGKSRGDDGRGAAGEC